MRTHILTASLLLVVPFTAGCDPAGAESADIDAAPPSAVIGVAANCPADAGPMRPAVAAVSSFDLPITKFWDLLEILRYTPTASDGAMVDRNRDTYVCTRRIRSIAGDSLRLTVDNDVPTPDSARVEPEIYVGM
jgi:hypothetical protein